MRGVLMRKASLLLALLLVVCFPCFGQATLDSILGRSDVSCPAPNHRVNASISQDNGTPGQAGTVKHITITGATIAQDANYSNDYDVTDGSLTFLIGIGEPMMTGGTGNSSDWTFVGDQLYGGDFITAVSTTAPYTITLTADRSVSASATAGWVQPGRFYDPFSQSNTIGATVTTAQFSIPTPFGAMYGICNPISHWYQPQAVSQMCVETDTGLCGISAIGLSSGSVSGGVVTEISSTTNLALTGGTTQVQVFGANDPSYDTNGCVTIQSFNAATGQFTYNQSTTNGTSIGGVVLICSGGGSANGNDYAIVSESQSAGVVTATYTVLLSVGVGAPITVSSVTGTGYNGNFHIASLFGNSLTYSDASASGTSTGGSFNLNGFVNFPARFSSACQAAQFEVTRAVNLGFNGPGEDSDGKTINDSNNAGITGCPTNPGQGNALSPYSGTVPFFTDYAMRDLFGNAPQPIKNIVNGIDHGWPGVFNAPIGEPDVADPNFFCFIMLNWGQSGTTAGSCGSVTPGGGVGLANWYRSMSGVAVENDDTDVFGYTNGSGQWQGISYGFNGNHAGGSSHVGLLVATTDPHQTASDHNSTVQLYPVDTVSVKHLSTVAPSGCWWYTAGTTSPGGNPIGPTQPICGSWLDWERNQYGTIANLNAAYGSNYSSFSSAETAVTGESPVGCTNSCTGNGTTTTFTMTLAHAPVPGSIHFNLTPSGGSKTFISGDCPFWSATNFNGCPSVSGGGTFLQPAGFPANTQVQSGYFFTDSNGCFEQANAKGTTGASFTPPASCTGTQTTTTGGVTFTAIGPATVNASSTVTYSSGAISVTFAFAPATGTVISLDYDFGGFPNGTGLADDDGTGASGVWGKGTANTSGTSVTLTSGSVATGSVLNNVDIKINGTDFQIASVQSATSLTLTSSAGTQTGVPYQVNGFGSNQVCLLNPPVWQANHAYSFGDFARATDGSSWQVVTVPGTSGATQPAFTNTLAAAVSEGPSSPQLSWASEGRPNCDANVGAWRAPIDAQSVLAQDLTNYLGEYTAQGLETNWKAAGLLLPDVIRLGTNFSLQSYDVPEYAAQLEANYFFTDGAFSGQFPMITSDARNAGATYDPLGKVKWQWLTNYYQKPIISEQFLAASDFDMGCLTIGFECFNSSVGRAQTFYDFIADALNWKSPAGFLQGAGITWWGNYHFQQKGFGYEDLSGNIADGTENVTATVAGDWGASSFNYGGEDTHFPLLNVNATTCTQCLHPALLEWLANPAPAATPAPTKKGMFGSVRLIDPAWMAERTEYRGERR